MKRCLALLLLASLAAGCKAPAPSIDPFFGRSTVPPPGPGEMPVENPAAYYPGAPNAPASAARRPDGQMPGAPGRPATQLASKPKAAKGGIGSQAISTPGATIRSATNKAEPAAAGSRVRAASPNEDSPAEKDDGEVDDREAADEPRHGSTLRIVPAKASAFIRKREAEAAKAAAEEDAKAEGEQDAEDEPEPAAPIRARFTGLRKSNGDSARKSVSTASFVQSIPVETEAGDEAEETPAASSKSASSRRSYGFDPDYAWVQGKLEYSQAAKQWKLRYIPIDGKTDEFGGSVVLADSDLLKEYKTGDFVTVRGNVSGRDPQGFSAIYRIEQIEK